MAIYTLTLTFTNPLTNGRKARVVKFDPDTFTQTKWNNAYPTVRADLDELIAAETPKEPATW